MKKVISILVGCICLTLANMTVVATPINTELKSFESSTIIKSDGSYWVWGANWYGGYDQAVPVQIHGLTDVEKTFGDQLVMKKDHTVWFWERDIPTGTIKVHMIPALNNLVSISDWNTIAVDEGGKVYVLARNGKLDINELNQLAPISGIDNVKDMSQYSTFFQEMDDYRWSFLKKDGTVWICNMRFPLEGFKQIKSLNNMIELERNFALKHDGTVWSWPDQGENELESLIAKPISNLLDIKSIKSFGGSNVAIDQKGSLWYWGETITGYTDGTTKHDQPVPNKLNTISDVKTAIVVERSLVVLTNKGLVYETSIHRESMPENPTFRVIAREVHEIKEGDRHFIMKKYDGSLWGWGVNRHGQLGCGDFEFMYDTPQRVQKPVSVYLDGTSIPLNRGVVIRNGQSFIPLRSVFERMGATLQWDMDTKTVTINQSQSGKEPIEISINYISGQVYLNQKQVQLENRPFIILDTSYLPLRFISESLGKKVDWDQNEGKISIASEILK